MATERIRYVDTGSVGGNGTTTALSGANAAYASLFACEAAENGNLVGADVWLHVYCAATGGTADTTAVTWNGGTVDATRYVLVEGATGQRATASGWKTDRYRLSVSNATAILLQDDYVRLDGLQIEVPVGDANSKDCLFINGIAASNDIRVSNCRMRVAAGATFTAYCIEVSDPDLVYVGYNNILEAHADNAGTIRGFNNAASTSCSLYNHIVYGFNRGVYDQTTKISIYDSAVLNNADDFYGTFAAIDYCASDDGDGTHAVTEDGGGADWTGDFTDGSAGDWTLLSTSNLVGAGGRAGSGIFSTDIEGTARGTAWDVGAYEYVSVTTNVVMNII